jgi:L-seryl-tRNA(Ser) seleniumtransferase
MSNSETLLRQLPSVDFLLQKSSVQGLEHDFARQICRTVLQRVRNDILKEGCHTLPEDWDKLLLQERERYQRPKLRNVINATGIVIHTNLGRSPLPKNVVDNITKVLAGYSNVEIDLETGKRGGRLAGIKERICNITGAEDCIVVNNNAAASLLAVTAIASGKEIVVSRGELVEIGGSFRIPDVISSGGATMVEVGCTNKTKVSDFLNVANDNTAAFLRVHTSNFKMVGFVQNPNRRELAQEAHKKQVVLIEDLGSGLLRKSPKIPNAQELEKDESVQRAIHEGVDLLTFSGDKLLGGVQAGFVVGRKSLVQKCKRHPLYRALRCCKLTYAALEPLLMIYERSEQHQIPVWKMLEKTEEQCKEQGERILQELHQNGCKGFSLQSTLNFTGGGALPNEELPSYALVWKVDKVEQVAQKLRIGNPAVLARIQDDSLLFEMRTILSEKELSLLQERISEQYHSINNINEGR